MPRKKSLPSELYLVARACNNLRAARQGPSAYAKRVVRRKVYGQEARFTRSVLKSFGLSA